jgi:acyl-CoA hydrolase
MSIDKKHTVKNSIIRMTELVLPNHTNQLGNLLGGQLMHWIDICAALASAKHSGKVCVTKSVDSIEFHHPSRLGDMVTLTASVNRAFHTSMEVGVTVYTQSLTKGEAVHSNSAYLTFVSVDENIRPVKTFEIVPETKDEKRRYEQALLRRESRLKNR